MKWIPIFKRSGLSGTNLPKSGKQIAVKITYPGGSLTEFAKKNDITFEDLIKFNRKLLRKYKSITNDPAKERFRSKIQGKELIVGYKSVETDTLSDSSSTASFINHDNAIKESVPSSEESVSRKRYEFEQKSIRAKIDELGITINKIQAKNISVEEIVNSFIEKEKLIKELNDTKFKLDSEKKEKQDLKNEINDYSEKLIRTDFLKQYAEVVVEYFRLVKAGYDKALELYRKLQNIDETSSVILGQLLMKYNLNLPHNTGKWEEILDGIIRNQLTSNNDLINSFRQYTTNEEKISEFKSILFKDIIKSFASAILILTEEISNLSKFIKNNENNTIIKEYEQYFRNFTKQLTDLTINIGLDFEHVPLFRHSKGIMGFTERASQECSLPYRILLGHLEKDSILEVVSYGFDKDEKTKVILA